MTPEQIEVIYAAQYHEKAYYGKFENEEDRGWEPDAVIKLKHTKAIKHILPHIKKILVGGCSSGMGVFEFRQIDVQAWGFEILRIWFGLYFRKSRHMFGVDR